MPEAKNKSKVFIAPEAKPCPFCGHKAIKKYSEFANQYMYSCGNTDCQVSLTCWFYLDEWNKRTRE